MDTENSKQKIAEYAEQWDNFFSQKPSSDCEWVSPPFKLQPTSKPLTKVEELQHKAAAAFKNFLTAGREDESACMSSESEGDEDEHEEEEKNGEGHGICFEAPALEKEVEVQKFFEKMFGKEEELRRFYLECFKKGYFECAVCRATGGKVWRIYPDCWGLVQHSMTVLNTKRKGAHRGYGKAICSLLGWSVDRFLGLSMRKRLQSLSLGESREEKNSCDEEDTKDEIAVSSEKDEDKHSKDDEDQEEEKEADSKHGS